MRPWRTLWRIAADALGHFNADDGWAIASHVALSGLMALFPFLIFMTALAGFLGSAGLAADAVRLLFQAWPPEIAGPIAAEVTTVLTRPRGDLLTFGAAVVLFLASNGVEALRVALNRAYRTSETRPFWRLRLQSLVFTLLGATLLLALALVLVAVPLVEMFASHLVPWLGDTQSWRLLVASAILLGGLSVAHLWLPCGRRRFRQVLPGIVFTFLTWLIGGWLFAFYLQYFANYVSTYAGLASVMVALVFLYLVAALFILGGELNAAIMARRDSARLSAPPGG